MKTRNARLKIKQGRRWVYQDIEIPTDDSVHELANRLHEAGQPHRETIGEWQVRYEPPRPIDYKAVTLDPFGSKPTEYEDVHLDGSSRFDIRFGDWLRPHWRISLSWHARESKPPFLHHDFKNLEFSPGSTQENLFDEKPPKGQASSAKPIFEGSAYQIEATRYERGAAGGQTLFLEQPGVRLCFWFWFWFFHRDLSKRAAGGQEKPWHPRRPGLCHPECVSDLE